MKLVVTGTPATGKTSVAKRLAKTTGGELISINDFVKQKRLGRKNKMDEIEVEPGVLEKALNAELKNKKRYVVEGHLACEVRLPADAVIVLRCDPFKLMARYKRRGYFWEKTRENMLAEALDYCLVRAEVSYGRGMVLQIDATARRKPEEILDAIRLWKSENSEWSRQMLPGGRLAFLLSGTKGFNPKRGSGGARNRRVEGLQKGFKNRGGEE